jgi:hypothetical protein
MPGASDASEQKQAPDQKVVGYGPMTQEAFQRMVQRKRTALREELKKAGTLTAELDTFLQGKPSVQTCQETRTFGTDHNLAR